MRGDLSFEEAEEAPFRPAAGAVLLRSAEEEAQLRIRAVAAQVHRGLPVGAHQQ